jgi:glycosyltransferase involved in cell wall biosynthesis
MNTPEAILAEFPPVEIVRTRWVDPTKKWMLARRVIEKIYGRAFLLERILRKHHIDVLSHSSHMGPRSRFPTIGWIPDFQHVRLPAFFSEKDCKERDGTFGRLADYCTRVIVSSDDARKDFANFTPAKADKAEVLHFVSGFGNTTAALTPKAELLARYGIEDSYFFLPNQFWIHKNHSVVIEALHRLKRSGHNITIVATGNTSDHRHPDYFGSLMERIESYDLKDNFRILGLVPYADIAALMRYSVAIINPSLFEGWSTTVEEAKSLGKTIILSNIPVHQEQAPQDGFFFDPNDAEDLKNKILFVLGQHSLENETNQQEKATRELPARIGAFARRFEDIAISATHPISSAST